MLHSYSAYLTLRLRVCHDIGQKDIFAELSSWAMHTSTSKDLHPSNYFPLIFEAIGCFAGHTFYLRLIIKLSRLKNSSAKGLRPGLAV